MSLKDDAELLIEINKQISELSKRLNELEGKEGVDPKELKGMKDTLMSLKKDAEVLEILNSVPHKEKKEPSSKEESDKRRKETNAKVHEIMDSLSDKKEETIRKPRVSKQKRYIATDVMKKMKALVASATKHISEAKIKALVANAIKHISEAKKKITMNLRNEPKDITAKDKMKGIIDLRSKPKNTQQKTNPIRTIKNGIKSLTYTPQHAMPNRYVAKGKEMVGKIRFLASNVGKNIATKASNVGKNIVANVSTARKNIAKNIKIARTLRDMAKLENKVAISKPKENKSERYTAKKGTKKRFATTLVAAAMGLAFVPPTLGLIPQVLENRRNNALDETIRVTQEYLEEISKVENINNSAKPSQDKNNTDSKPNQSNTNSKPEEKPSQSNNLKLENEPDKNNAHIQQNQSNSNSKPNENNTNSKPEEKPSQSNNSKPESEIDKNNTNTELNQNNSNSKPSQNNNSKPEEKPENNNKPEDQIKKIYGGEISASENGILTEEDILYAATQMGWRKEIIDNIKEMMPGLLAIQYDFDVSSLAALATFQGESNCGTAYTKYGQYRLANIEYWVGQLEVVGYSGTGYGCYNDFSSAAYDFGNYVRNGPPYAKSEKGAQTMADLQNFGENEGIFNNAGTKYAAIYNQLKACLEKRGTIGIEDVSKAVKECTTSDIEKMTYSITMSAKEHNSLNKEMAGR